MLAIVLIYTTYAVARLHSAEFALGCMLFRLCVQVHCDACYLHVRPEFHPATRCASASLHIRSVSGCPETIPKVCPIWVLVLLGGVRPCSLPPVRILSCKKKKKKKKLPVEEDAAVTRMPCAPSLPQGGRHCIIPYDIPYHCFLLSLTMYGTLAHSPLMLVRAPPTGAFGLLALSWFLLLC